MAGVLFDWIQKPPCNYDSIYQNDLDRYKFLATDTIPQTGTEEFNITLSAFNASQIIMASVPVSVRKSGNIVSASIGSNGLSGTITTPVNDIFIAISPFNPTTGIQITPNNWVVKPILITFNTVEEVVLLRYFSIPGNNQFQIRRVGGGTFPTGTITFPKPLYLSWNID